MTKSNAILFQRLTRRLAMGVPAIALVLLNLVTVVGRADAVKAHEGKIDIPTYPWSAVKHPYFRGTDGRNIYPYPMLDNLSRAKEPRTYRTVVLENEYLRITFLPELGGKIHEVIDKTTGQPMFYVNHVIKPGLIGQCGAWTSGGVEWNTGPQGHTVSCMQPVAVVILPPEKDGSRSVAIGETERIYGTKWTVIVTLRPGRSFIEERVRIYNPIETIRPYYFWNCAAVPNTPGFRFIYPMTLGTDHGSEKFFNWPIHEGKDLSRGTNYQDASSIFAWHCDQDFFGSYDDGADRGVVAYANHHQLPGKKAWTWGQGGFGKMHQMDLTDDDGPYNEVQTGPLLTQGEVGRLDPCEAVSWQEWWYPVHGIGGFTFANKDVAVNAAVEGGKLRLRIAGSGSWNPVFVAVRSPGEVDVIAHGQTRLSPKQPSHLELDLRGVGQPLDVQIRHFEDDLARFRFPLDLPTRQPPDKKHPTQTAAEFTEAGWQHSLFARFPEAEAEFHKALVKEPKSVAAHTGLAYLNLDRNPATAAEQARAALEVNPDHGLARLALAVSEHRLGDEKSALDAARKASFDPATAVAGRALAAKLLLRRGDWQSVKEALAGPGPWEHDSVCRNRLALALQRLEEVKSAARFAADNLAVDPLDAFASSILWLTGREIKSLRLGELIDGNAGAVLDLAAQFADLAQEQTAEQMLVHWFHKSLPGERREPIAALRPGERHEQIVSFWIAYLIARARQNDPYKMPAAEKSLHMANDLPTEGIFPHRIEVLPVLRWTLQRNPNDGQAALYLGHLLFHLGRHAEGRAMWKKAAELAAEPAVAYRALGMASLNLDHDPEAAAKYLTQANEADRTDAIVARDLAKVLFTLADKADSAGRKKELWSRARDSLKAAFAQGQGRSDFVSLLARAQSRLGEHAETTQMLDSVRVTVWEGSREVHDLFEEAHLVLGNAHLEAGRAKEALAEFDRALEYPPNLATGKLENTRETHIHYLRGNALAALGRRPEAIAAWKQAADEPASKNQNKEEARQKAKEALEKAAR